MAILWFNESDDAFARRIEEQANAASRRVKIGQEPRRSYRRGRINDYFCRGGNDPVSAASCSLGNTTLQTID